MAIQAPKGTKDVLPGDSYKWHHIESVMRAVAKSYGYREIRTPVFEHTELFLRGIGDTTDVVQKEMYTFTDKGDRSVTLKPEGTAGVARAFLENKLYAGAQPTKLYYLNCPVFRYERPQAGRLREHHQFGIECFGSPDALADAQTIAFAKGIFDRLGVTQLSLNINSIGCPNCRPSYNEKLKSHFAPHIHAMCEDCTGRFEKNPLRLLDCKVDACKQFAQDAPTMLDCLCEECSAHFAQLQEYLRTMGIAFTVDSRIVRGLDYYSKTVFEFVSTAIGAQGTVCGGGRYDGLIGQLGGESLPGVGFGMGMERLLLVLDGQSLLPQAPPIFDLFFVTMNHAAKVKALELSHALRQKGVASELDNMNRSIKAQFKYADKLDVRYVAVLGEDELKDGVVTLKNMKEDTGEKQRRIEWEELVSWANF